MMRGIARHDEARVYSYTAFKARPAMSYFRWWSDGMVAQNVKRDLLIVHPGIGLLEQRRATATLVESEAVSLLAQHRQADCPEAARLAERHQWNLHDFAEDTKAATNHAVLRSHLGVLQYVALRNGRVVTADPPACETVALLQAPELLQRQTPPAVNDTGGAPQILDVKNDPLVKDCENLFHRTATKVCKKDFEMEVLSAVVEVINGFIVEMTVVLTSEAGKESLHYPKCAFQTTNPNDPAQEDSSLVESIAEGEQTPEEKAGMEATLHLTVPLCSADSTSETNGPGSIVGTVQSNQGLLMELKTKRLGDLTQTKGYRHLRPPAALVESNGNEPSDYSQRVAYPGCFPDNGVEVVRNQGTCGSCWAFASATSMMHNICCSAQQPTSPRPMIDSRWPPKCFCPATTLSPAALAARQATLQAPQRTSGVSSRRRTSSTSAAADIRTITSRRTPQAARPRRGGRNARRLLRHLAGSSTECKASMERA